MPDLMRKALTLLSIVAPVRPLVGPNSANVEVSTRCNFTCLMCPYHSSLTGNTVRGHRDLIDSKLADNVLQSVARLGAGTVVFAGRGEPLLHPEIGSIVSRATSLGCKSVLITNGSLLDERRGSDLVQAGLGTLAVSLVAASPDAYVDMHPGASRETFCRVLDSLARFQRMKRGDRATRPRLDLRFILTARSHLDIEKMIDLGIELGAQSVHFVPFKYRFRPEIGVLAPTREEEGLAVKRIRELAPKAAGAGLEINTEEISAFHMLGPNGRRIPCYAGWFEVCVLVDGSIKFCVGSNKVLGNANERPLDQVWLGAEYGKLRSAATRPEMRGKIGEFDCDRCWPLYHNWLTNRRLASLRLAPGPSFAAGPALP